MTGNWQNWGDKHCADILYRRARDELPEMESSKAVARRIKAIWASGDTILDVGCGAGHYLVSLRRELGARLDYCGVDHLRHHIELARKAFENDPHVRFELADLYKLPYANSSFDIVTCNNLLQNLPALREPLCELMRVARRALVMTTPISFARCILTIRSSMPLASHSNTIFTPHSPDNALSFGAAYAS